MLFMWPGVAQVDWRSLQAAGKLTDKQQKLAEKIRYIQTNTGLIYCMHSLLAYHTYAAGIEAAAGYLSRNCYSASTMMGQQ